MDFVGNSPEYLKRRCRALDYLVVAQLYLQNNFLVRNDLTSKDIKPRLLGHWGTCHGINVVYSNLKAALQNNFTFILGPGHGFPALQANLFLDGELAKVDLKATRDEAGLAYLCKNFSWPGGFPSHASPLTPGVICEGGELGYALATAYGAALGHPEKTIAVLIGDGEFETATALASMNLVKLLGDPETGKGPNGRVLPFLHLNGYKISAPTIAARKSMRELSELIRGFGFNPIVIEDDSPETFQAALTPVLAGMNYTKAPSRGDNYATALYNHAFRHTENEVKNPFFIFRSKKGATGPALVHGNRISDNYLAHQIPLKNPRTDAEELELLERWLHSYRFEELFDPEKGFIL